MVGLAAGILSGLRTPVYKATARVLLTPNNPTEQLDPKNVGPNLGNDPDRYVAGQQGILTSEGVAREAAKSLRGLSAKDVERKLSVSQGGQSDILDISGSDADPVQARDIANAVAKGYIENRRQAAVSGLQQAAKDVEDRLGPLQTSIGQLDQQIGEGSTLPGATSQLVSPAPPGSATTPIAPGPQPGQGTDAGGQPSTKEALKAARYAAAVQYETLYARQQELLVDISLKRGEAELISEAKVPGAPASPHPKRDAVLGVLAGLLLGVGVSFLREQLNDRVRSADEVERLTGLPLLAQLPYDEESAKGTEAVAVLERPNSPLGEGMRSLRTSIQYLGVDQPVKVVVVTSASPKEGKSLVAANLAVVFAQADYRTLLVSADLRRSSINHLFGALDPSPGLTGVIAPTLAGGTAPRANGHGAGPPGPTDGTGSLEGLVKTPIPNLLLLPSGPTPPNPAELLGSKRMTGVLAECASFADVVVIDTPPLLPVTDAAVLAAKSDGVVLVTAINETRRAATHRAKTILDGTGARLLGVVVNKSPKSGGGAYYYAGYYGESPRVTKKGRRARRERRTAELESTLSG